MKPLDAWQRPEGYWLATSPSYPGWSEQEQKEVAALREKERDATSLP
ncbi:hypothetical protein ABZ471_47830 [Streptomyces sp. NPDC005728]